ncbi:bile acid:sodium symporter family protein [Calycomorphotria hydatis]|uniref:Sodium Bile acid symporter family protein n=1 Tax=Calycomorphotria hydatis TaxID=2528027 RepID=A0A517T3Z1_9PLAN|nr:bile acid:sodium symporter [Calycomorphotria hydatis]QDT63097.1 Sodium Bile acid symporter family protein [Calycomorphotria hydatis]
MQQLLLKNWFLVGLAVVIPTGILLGLFAGETLVGRAVHGLDTRITTAMILLLMSFTLDTKRLTKALREPLPVFTALVLNTVCIPLLAWPISLLFSTPDFRYGLLIACCVPCTMAAASVWTRQAGGNDAVSMLVTIITNGFCFLTTPFWVLMTTGVGITLDPWEMMQRLFFTAVIPMIVGQVARNLPMLADFAVRYKSGWTTLAQCFILAIVLHASAGGGSQMHATGVAPNLWELLTVAVACTVIHCSALFAGWWISGQLKFPAVDRAPVAFSGSQKTIPIGMLVATSPTMFGNPDLLGEGIGVPFAVFPMIIYHATQLFIDSAMIPYFSRVVAETDAARTNDT